MASHHLTNRLTVLALNIGLATATAMVLWITWTGYLIATGQVHPPLPAAAPPAQLMPAGMAAPNCPCQHQRRDELQVRAQNEREAT
jgi:hypothetical protein